VDIRDTVNYKNVMKQYSLGPNGGILTSLNLFATRFDQVRAFLALLCCLLLPSCSARVFGSAGGAATVEVCQPLPDLAAMPRPAGSQLCSWCGRCPIVTTLCSFAILEGQVVGLCEKPRDPPHKYIVADTPGQIEIFTWSASGAIITEVRAARQFARSAGGSRMAAHMLANVAASTKEAWSVALETLLLAVACWPVAD
jgi:hypothetical protein